MCSTKLYYMCNTEVLFRIRPLCLMQIKLCVNVSIHFSFWLRSWLSRQSSCVIVVSAPKVRYDSIALIRKNMKIKRQEQDLERERFFNEARVPMRVLTSIWVQTCVCLWGSAVCQSSEAVCSLSGNRQNTMFSLFSLSLSLSFILSRFFSLGFCSRDWTSKVEAVHLVQLFNLSCCFLKASYSSQHRL